MRRGIEFPSESLSLVSVGCHTACATSFHHVVSSSRAVMQLHPLDKADRSIGLPFVFVGFCSRSSLRRFVYAESKARSVT